MIAIMILQYRETVIINPCAPAVFNNRSLNDCNSQVKMSQIYKCILYAYIYYILSKCTQGNTFLLTVALPLIANAEYMW